MRRSKGYQYKRVSDTAAIPSDQIEYFNEDPATQFSGATCKFCTGSIVMIAEGVGHFFHSDDCVFKAGNNNGSDFEDEEGLDEDSQGFCEVGDEAAMEIDYEGDSLVEMMKKRLERIQVGRHKMRPNVSQEWVAKLKEYLRVLGG